MRPRAGRSGWLALGAAALLWASPGQAPLAAPPDDPPDHGGDANKAAGVEVGGPSAAQAADEVSSAPPPSAPAEPPAGGTAGSPLAETPDTPPPPPPPPIRPPAERRGTGTAKAEVPPPLPVAGAAKRNRRTPHLEWEGPIWCMDGPQGEPVRVQCRTPPTGDRFCLVASNQQRPSGRPLGRTNACSSRERSTRYVQLIKEGYRMVAAVAEAPPGWYRDERGRVFQVTFDLLDRFYFGAGWLPLFDPVDSKQTTLQRARFEMGFSASTLDTRRRRRARHSFRAFEGSLSLADLETHGLLFNYERTNRTTRPLLRLTTFIGEPERHDLYMDTGWGLRLVQVHGRPHGAEGITDMEFGEVHMASALWQSQDLYDHLRLRFGASSGALYGEGETPYWVAPGITLDARFGLDSDGYHYLFGEAFATAPWLLSGEHSGARRTRAGGSLAYEVIFLAVNDQPLSLRLEGRIDYRDDLPAGSPELEASALAGLRFSFWAPARDERDLPPLER